MGDEKLLEKNGSSSNPPGSTMPSNWLTAHEILICLRAKRHFDMNWV
jgi:hypothetical protein